MIKRLSAAIAALGLALAIAGPVSASPMAIDVNGDIMFATTAQTCQDPEWWTPNNFQGNRYGNGYGGNAFDIFGARAVIDVADNDFSSCFRGNSLLDWDGGVSAWVALVPGAGNPEYGNNNAIIQIGLIECHETVVPSNSPCTTTTDNQHNVHMFWAAGGCNGVAPLPIDLGPISKSEHQFWISAKYNAADTSLEYYFGHSDSNRKNNIFDIKLGTAGSGDAVTCWLPFTTSQGQNTKPLHVEVLGERWDISDSSGNCNTCTDAGHTFFNSNRFQILPYGPSGSWLTMTFPTSPSPGGCNVDTVSDGGCDVTNADPDSFSIWDD